MNHGGHVYMMASGRHGTLYTGVTARIATRVGEHREGSSRGFTSEYHVNRLVWLEHFEGIESAIAREKQIKKWRREWKVNLIEAGNPEWADLAVAMFGYPENSFTRHPREGGDPSPQSSGVMGPRLRGDDESE